MLGEHTKYKHVVSYAEQGCRADCPAPKASPLAGAAEARQKRSGKSAPRLCRTVNDYRRTALQSKNKMCAGD